MLVEGKVAIVLGGAGGIGKASCRALLERGAMVCCGDLVGEEAIGELSREFPDERRLIYFRCDSTRDDDIKAMFTKTTQHFGKLPEVVMTTVAVLNEFDWQKCVDVNLSGSIRLVNAALALMGVNKGGKGGVVVLTSSISGLQPEYWGPVYAATKHAIIGLARSWAEEMNYKGHGVRFNSLCPGCVDTPFLSQIHNAFYGDIHQKRINEAQRIAPETVAKAFIRIIEDDSINGATIRISTENAFEFHQFSPLGV